MRRLILRSFQSPGDVLMLTAAVRDLHKAYPHQFQTNARSGGRPGEEPCVVIPGGREPAHGAAYSLHQFLSLSDNTSSILAWGNENGFKYTFVEQLRNQAWPGDLLIVFNGSGKSANILRAVVWANRAGLTTWSATGFDDGELRELAQSSLHVPCRDMGQVECIHLLLFHWILERLRDRISGPGWRNRPCMEPEVAIPLHPMAEGAR